METQQIYIPLAKRLGLFDIAEEMDYLCISYDDREDQNRLKLLTEKYEELSREFQEQAVVDKINSVLGFGLKIHARLASVAAAYRDPESKFHINVDITFNHDFDDVGAWGNSVMRLAQNFTGSHHNLQATEMPSGPEFDKQIKEGSTDSLGFWVSPGYLGLIYHIHMYPHDVYELEMSKITDMYYISKLPDDLIEQRRQLAEKKHKLLGQKLLQISTTDSPHDVPATRSLISLLEPRLPALSVSIVESDEKGHSVLRHVREGSTALDYIRYIRPDDWAKADKVFINGTIASFSTVLRERDTIQIIDGNELSYDPAGIFSFIIDRGGPEEVRKNIMKILRKSDTEKRDRLYRRILDVGAERIEQLLPPDERPFRYGFQAKELHDFLATAANEVKLFINDNNLREVFSAMNTTRSMENDEVYFRIGVGLGIFDQAILDRIMNKAREINNKVMVMEVQFSDDLPGQLALLTTLAAQRNINLLSDPGAIPDGGPVVCRLYVKPEDIDKLQQLLDDIQTNPELKEKSFAFARYHPANEKNVYFS